MPYDTWPPKQDRATNYSEEPVVIVSKEDLCQVWAGPKIMFSGSWTSGDPIGGGDGASGYNFLSGETDVSPVNHSGWGLIRVPELSEVHFALITPKMPCIQAAPDWTGGNCSGYPESGIGGISGNMIQVHYCDTCMAAEDRFLSGDICWYSGGYLSGVVDIVAFGSKY